MDDKKKLAIIGGYLMIFDEDLKKRRVWSKRWYLERQKYSHVSLLQELEIREPTDLHNFLWMDKESFETLLEAVRFKIERKNTQMREAVYEFKQSYTYNKIKFALVTILEKKLM
nr:unnamed protein product [Callosobruchus chinensis]